MIEYPMIDSNFTYPILSPDYRLPITEIDDDWTMSNIKNLQDFIDNKNRDYTIKLGDPDICQKHFNTSKSIKLLLAIRWVESRYFYL